MKAQLGEVIDVAGVDYTVWSDGPKKGTYFAFRGNTANGKTVWALVTWRNGRWYNTGIHGVEELPEKPSIKRVEVPGQSAIDSHDPGTHARTSDPVTSKAGARSAAMRAGTHKARLLAVYAHAVDGLTDADAAQDADLLSVGYWKRCSDLRNAGLIEPMLRDSGNVAVRYTANGDANMVCRITDRGLATLAAMKESHATQPEYVTTVCVTCGGHNAVHHADCERLAALSDPEPDPDYYAGDFGVIDGMDSYGSIQ